MFAVFATVYRFSDNNCQDYLEGHSYFLGCAENVQDSYAVITYAQSLECVANHDVLPIPLTANYIMQRWVVSFSVFDIIL